MSKFQLILSAALILLDLLVCISIGFKTRGSAKTAEDYFIGGKTIGPVLLFLTAWASFSGSGNFIGQAGRGALYGVSAYWQWLGDGLVAGILVGFVLSPYLAKFRYLSMAHYISDYLYGGDLYLRRLGGMASLLPNVIWPGAQIMGVSYVMDQVFGIDYRAACILCGIVFIFYTMTGGIKAVIFADAFHGVIQMVFAVLVIYYGLKLFNFDFSFLKNSIIEVNPEKWNLFTIKPFAVVSSFLTGLVGVLSSPNYWNRAFAARDVATARKAFGITFICNIFLVFAVIAIGISSLMYIEASDQALVWVILNKMPVICKIILAESVLAACISCADTHLNCAAANVVTDIVDPAGKLSGNQSVRLARIATLVAGIAAILAGLYGSFIYAIGNFGYTVCGGVLIPLFLMGLLFRDRKAEQFRSRLSVSAARIGGTIGLIAALLFELIPAWYNIFGGGVIPAIIFTILGTIVPNFFYHNQTWKKYDINF